MAGLCCAALSLAVASQQPRVRHVAACRPHHSIWSWLGRLLTMPSLYITASGALHGSCSGMALNLLLLHLPS